MQKKHIYGLLAALLLPFQSLLAQDSSLLKMLNDSAGADTHQELVIGTFKATQLINMPTIESPAKQNLQFLIMHRFGKLNQGAYELFGLDNASIRFGLDYGISDRLSVGIGRSSLDKAFDGSVKWKILEQYTTGMPVSISLNEVINNYTQKYVDKPFLDARYRTSYTSQLLIARKFSRNLSLELMPSLIHYNLTPTPDDKTNVFVVSAGGRMKITKRMSIDAEYNYLLPNQVVSYKVYNTLSLGLDLETGGHVFQLVFTNASGMAAPYYLAKSDGSWGKGDIFFGFNISRNFNFRKRK